MIPFLDLRQTYEELRDELDAAVQAELRSGYYIGGPTVDGFESAFATHVDADHCVGVGNGLDALHLALLALGLRPGDEVIVPANTYIATWLAVTHAGGTPVPVEPSPATFNIEASAIKTVLTERTRGIIPVHLYGHPADLDPILELAKQHDLFVLEDAAQAHGARYRGRRLGAHGHAVAWSFYPGKNLGAFGDAGAVTTSDPALADKIRVLRNYGSRVKYVNEVIGFNSRLDPIQAAVLGVKLKHLDDWNRRRQEIATFYLSALKDTSLKLPSVAPWAEHVWHLFVVRHERRDELQRRLADEGIGTLIHYPVPPFSQAAYRRQHPEASVFPIASEMANSVLSLPIGPHISHSDASRVVEAVVDADRSLS